MADGAGSPQRVRAARQQRLFITCRAWASRVKRRSRALQPWQWPGGCRLQDAWLHKAAESRESHRVRLGVLRVLSGQHRSRRGSPRGPACMRRWRSREPHGSPRHGPARKQRKRACVAHGRTACCVTPTLMRRVACAIPWVRRRTARGLLAGKAAPRGRPLLRACLLHRLHVRSSRRRRLHRPQDEEERHVGVYLPCSEP
jgi:hypothetical protein